jgi:hypothetical protein
MLMEIILSLMRAGFRLARHPEIQIWKGYRVANKVISKGTLLRLVKNGKETVIKYPVIHIKRRQTIAS